MTADEAEEFHSWQVGVLAGHGGRQRHRHDDHLRRGGDRDRPRGDDRGAPGRDLVHGRDGRPAAERAAARRGDRARWTARRTGVAAYFMVNCAHPTHFLPVLDEPGPWDRILGIRANASTKSHAELDESEELDDGDPAELASGYLAIGERLPHLTVLGGCCGTDHRHVASIADAWFATAAGRSLTSAASPPSSSPTAEPHCEVARPRARAARRSGRRRAPARSAGCGTGRGRRRRRRRRAPARPSR